MYIVLCMYYWISTYQFNMDLFSWYFSSGDDPDRRDSEGFDISPKNPESDNDSPTSDLSNIVPLIDNQESSVDQDPKLASSSQTEMSIPEVSHATESCVDMITNTDMSGKSIESSEAKNIASSSNRDAA